MVNHIRGALTQYYAIILSFWGVLFFAFYLLRRKEIKTMLIYGSGALISILLMVFSYPYVITQATGSSTNNVGNEVVANLFNIKLWIVMTISLVREFIISISYHPYVSYAIVGILLLALICSVLVKLKKKEEIFVIDKTVIWLVLTTMMVFLSISFIGGEYVYLRYIYYIIPILYIIAVLLVEYMFGNYKTIRTLVVAVLIVFSISNALIGMTGDRLSYLYKSDYENDLVLKDYDENLCFVVTGKKKTTAVPTGNLTKLSQFDSVYMDTSDNIQMSGIIPQYLEKNQKCVVYLCTDTYWTQGVSPDEFFKETLPDNVLYSLICQGTLGKFYLISID